jgi:Glycosyl hydrolase family 47
MFHHAYNGYLKYAYPLDELRPLTCDGHDTWGRYDFAIFMKIVHVLVYVSDLLH